MDESPTTAIITIGVLALQGAFAEHIRLLQQAAAATSKQLLLPESDTHVTFSFIEVRTPLDLSRCDALILPGGESTSIALIAERTGLLDPLRNFVKLARRPVWGTCAGLILLAERADRTKATGQALIGGLDVRVQRNYFGRQVESFEAELELGFLNDGDEQEPNGKKDDREAARRPFHSVFIRAPVVKELLPTTTTGNEPFPLPSLNVAEEGEQQTAPAFVTAPTTSTTSPRPPVEILARLPAQARALPDLRTTADELGEAGDIVAVRQGNVFGTAFHPELTGDARIHAWWLREVVRAVVSKR